MDSTQRNSRECLQQDIDAEIKSLEESLRALKLRRNALSSISSLPPEVFATIFAFASLPGIPSLGGEPDHHLARFHVSHVCHQWREIALNQPLLWSHIDFTTLSWECATEMLVRAKSVPLCLESRISSRRWGNHQFCTFGKELQAHVPCILHLDIRAAPVNLVWTLEELVSPAPALKYLSLFSRGGSRSNDEAYIPGTLFKGSTPRLSFLELRKCGINWKSPLLKGLKHLEILTPSENTRPNLAVWLNTLTEIPQLKTLTLHLASPISPPLPFYVERTVTLPSLTHLDISDSVGRCALALAHLDLPALTWLCLTVFIYRPFSSNVQGVLPYIVQHAHGSQDTRPLQSLLIRNRESRLDILAWSVPDIDVEMHDPPALLGATLPTRVALSFKSKNWRGCDTQLEILNAVMTVLPLDSLGVLTASDIDKDTYQLSRDLSMPRFWLRHSPKWPLLRRVRLTYPVERGFVEMLLEDDGECESPILPSLTELVLIDGELSAPWTRCLCDALMKRVEQGVPLEMLDLRTYPNPNHTAELRLLREIVVDVLDPIYRYDPEEQLDARGKMVLRMMSLWNGLACGSGPFLDDDDPDDEDNEE